MGAELLGDLARSLQYLAAGVLFGSCLFTVAVGRPAFRASAGASEAWQALERRRHVVVVACLLLVLASGLLWLWSVAAIMADTSLAEAVSHTLWATVMGETSFGAIALWRLALLALLTLAFLRARHRAHPKGGGLASRAELFLAGALLATIALTGHANAELGPAHGWHLAADMVHLLAFGAWLGSLPLLFLTLSRGPGEIGQVSLAVAHGLAWRTSALGLVSVVAIVATGLVNSWYTVGSFANLVESRHGRLLALKLALFLVMLVLAGMNLLRETPQLGDGRIPAAEQARALRRLRRNIALEMAFAFLLLLVVGALVAAAPTPPP
jgi:copper resistance protein D